MIGFAERLNYHSQFMGTIYCTSNNTMQCFLNPVAYFDTAIIYDHNIFVKLTPGGDEKVNGICIQWN